MEFSNKNLALVLVVAIVVSLGGTIISLNKLNEVSAPSKGIVTTGRASAVGGYVNLSINSNSSCTIDKSIQFGSGKPTQERTLSSDVNNDFDGWTCDGTDPGSDCMGIVVNNTGNIYLNISFNSSHTGSTLLGGTHTNDDFAWVADDTEIETDSCITFQSEWQNVAEGTSNNSNVCSYLNFTDSTDIIVIDFNVTVDQNTAPGTKTATITVGCMDATIE